MSSLTTIGINKNKKKFGPTINKNKNRRKATEPSSTTKASSSQTASSQPTPSQETLNQSTSSQSAIIQPTFSQSSPNQTDNNIKNEQSIKPEVLTEEELAINEFLPTSRFTNQPKVIPAPEVTEKKHSAGTSNNDPLSEDEEDAPSAVDAFSPLEYPSTPGYPTPGAMATSPEYTNTPAAMAASPEYTNTPTAMDTTRDDSDTQTDIMSTNIEDKESGNPDALTPSESPKAAPKRKRSAKKIIAEIENDDDDLDPDFVETSAKKTRVKNKGKSKEISASNPKLKETSAKKTAANNKGKGKEVSISSPKRKESSKSTPIAIGIGMPSSSISVPEPTQASIRERQRKEAEEKRRAEDYRLPENFKTLDDITGDPSKPELLDKPMSYFIKDIDGVVSKAFKEMETRRHEELKKMEEAKTMSGDELEEFKKKKAEEEEKREKLEKEKRAEEEKRRKEKANSILQETSNAPQVRMVNGQIVLDTDSLTIERSQNDQEFYDGAMEVVEESSMTRKVNSHTYGKRKQSSRWSAPETEMFYELLAQFGTDFETISKVIPNRTRAQVRMKFNREEKLCPDKVTEYLIHKRKKADLNMFKEMAGVELEPVPDDFNEMQLV